MSARVEHLVSVIIPVYNCERYLGEAIASVLAQTYHPIEIIVVDDGSTDGSAKVAQSFDSVQYVYQPNGGTGSARNHGIALARGEYLAFLDADDLWTEDKLSLQMAAFQAQPDLDAVFCHIQQFFSPDIDPAKRVRALHGEGVMVSYNSDGILIRAESFQRVGPFWPGQRIGEFIEWFTRAREHGLKMALLPNILAKRRIHDANKMIQSRAEVASSLIGILRAKLKRSRTFDRLGE